MPLKTDYITKIKVLQPLFKITMLHVLTQENTKANTLSSSLTEKNKKKKTNTYLSTPEIIK